MKNVAFTLIFYAALGGLTWLGFDRGVAGAANVVMFGLWLVLVPIGFLTVIGAVVEGGAIKAAAKAKFPEWASFIARAVRWFCLGLLVWKGAWVTAVGFSVFMFCIAVANRAIEDAREKRAAEALAQATGEAA